MTVQLVAIFLLSVCPFVLLSEDGLFDDDNDFYDILRESETDLLAETTPTTSTTTLTTTTMNVTLGQTDPTKATMISSTASNTAEALKILSGVIAAVASFYAALVSLLKYKLKLSTRRSLLLGLPGDRPAQTSDFDASSLPEASPQETAV